MAQAAVTRLWAGFVDDNPQNKIIAKKLLEKDSQIEDLQKKVGELTMANDFYKKKFPS